MSEMYSCTKNNVWRSVSKEQCVEISIYPASKTYRIIPITKKGNEYIACSFEKNINKYVENFCNYGYYL